MVWAQPTASGVWLGKVEDAAHPCRRLHVKLELKQNALQVSGILSFRNEGRPGYQELGALKGTALETAYGLELTLRGTLTDHLSLPDTLAGAVELSVSITEYKVPVTSEALSRTAPRAFASASGPPKINFDKLRDPAKGASEAQYFGGLDFVWALQHLDVKQLEHLSRYAQKIARDRQLSMERLDELALRETLKLFRASCESN